MKEISDEIKLTIEMMQGDIDDGAHGDLQWHLYSLLEMKRDLLARNSYRGEHCRGTLIGKRAGGGVIIGFEGDDAIIMCKAGFGPMIWDDAVKFCEAFFLGEHGDWRLPTKEQLNLAWVNREKLGGLSIGGWYWSASQGSATSAHYQYFGDGVKGTSHKSNLFGVRPVRSVKIESL